MTRFFTLFFSLLIIANSAFAQPVINLRTGNIVNNSPDKNPANNPLLFSSNLYNGRHYVWLQFNAIPTESIKNALSETGVVLFSYLPDRTFIASFPENYDYNLLKNYAVYAVTQPLSIYKIDPPIFDASSIAWAVENDSMRSVYISFVPTVSREQLATILADANILFTRLPDSDGVELVVKASIGQLQKIAAHPLVNYIEAIAPPPVLEDIQGTSNHRTSLAATSDNWATGRKLDGDGIVIAIGDDGFIGPHIDFTGRIAINANTTTSTNTHADHCAGIILGAGNMNPTIRGNAPAATLRAYDSYADFSLYPTIYNTDNVRITTHSLGQTCNGGYTSNARTSDLQLRTYPSLMHVHSAGNSGADVCGGLTGGWKTITGGYKAGKNVLAVANLTKSDVISSSSSKGPLPDGRLKPDIAAVGNAVNSTQPNNAYVSMSGTSMASPAVAGTLAVLYQAYKKQYGTDPNSGLIKAILMNTADDLGNPGPDFTYGFGRTNARKAIECIENGRYFSGSISQGITNTHSIEVPNNVAKAKVMVYWVDKEATAGANPSLVNNIDSWIITPATWTESPWILDAGAIPSAASCNAPATKGGIDTINNVEQIEMDAPPVGVYQLKISGAKIPSGPQDYYVVVEYLYNNQIVVTHPFGGESFVPGETQRIRWDATENTGNFTLQYSANAGSSWSTLSSSVSGTTRYYDWTVPSTVTGQARIRVSRGAGSDMSDTNFVVLGVPVISSITAVCTSVSKITWSAVTGANGYDVFKLGNKFMELVGSTTTATNLNVASPVGSDEYFAVRAKLGTRQYGRRTNAMNHNNFFVGTCNLPLQLVAFSATKKANAVVLTWQTAQEQNLLKFVVERSLTPTFDNITIVGEANARNASQQEYVLIDKNTVTKGTYFYRLKIVEKDRIVYSAIRSIKWDGFKGSISMYPNPTSNNIFIQSQEDYGMVDAQLINATGAVIQSWIWNLKNGSTVTADVSKIPAGNYFMLLQKSGSIISRQQVTVIK